MPKKPTLGYSTYLHRYQMPCLSFPQTSSQYLRPQTHLTSVLRCKAVHTKETLGLLQWHVHFALVARPLVLVHWLHSSSNSDMMIRNVQRKLQAVLGFERFAFGIDGIFFKVLTPFFCSHGNGVQVHARTRQKKAGRFFASCSNREIQDLEQRSCGAISIAKDCWVELLFNDRCRRWIRTLRPANHFFGKKLSFLSLRIII